MRRTMKWLALLALVIPVFALSTAASAAPTPVTPATQPTVVVERAEATSVGGIGTSTEQRCPVYPWKTATPVGYKLCGTESFRFVWDDGRVHSFVIGENGSVYNLIEYAGGGNSGWRSLGGTSYIGVYPNHLNHAMDLSIKVVGTNNRWYCRHLWYGSWGQWTRDNCPA